MALNQTQFTETKIGTGVCTVTGPGQSPERGLCERVGKITGKVIGRWGRYFEVEFEDGKTDTMHGIQTKHGIGFYILEG